MAQTGGTGSERRDLLRRFGLLAHERLVHEWRALEPRGPLP